MTYRSSSAGMYRSFTTTSHQSLITFRTGRATDQLTLVINGPSGVVPFQGNDCSLSFNPFLEFFADASSIDLTTTDLDHDCDPESD